MTRKVLWLEGVLIRKGQVDDMVEIESLGRREPEFASFVDELFARFGQRNSL